MKKYLILFLILSTILSCEKAGNKIIDKSCFWSPVIKIEKGNKEATLFLTDPRPFTEYYPFPPSNPDYFEIYYSNNLASFSLYRKVDVLTARVSITNLQNEEPYYFFVISNKNNFEPIFSDTLMTICSTYREPAELSPKFDFSVERVSLSYDKTYITFTSDNCPVQNNSSDIIYYKSISTGSIDIIEENAYDASWSPIMNTFAYISIKKTGNWIYPCKLRTFDVESKKSSTLFEIDFDKYYISTPVFSPDGKYISFLSSENSSEKYFYNIWTIDPDTKVKSRISDFESLGFITEGSFNWSSNGEDIYLFGHLQHGSSRNKLYRFNNSTKQLVPVIESLWDDKTPSISPDNSKIAFISNRSGDDELWIYDLITMNYGQLTGSSFYKLDSRYTNIQWLNSNEILLTLFKDNTSKAVKMDAE